MNVEKELAKQAELKELEAEPELEPEPEPDISDMVPSKDLEVACVIKVKKRTRLLKGIIRKVCRSTGIVPVV